VFSLHLSCVLLFLLSLSLSFLYLRLHNSISGIEHGLLSRGQANSFSGTAGGEHRNANGKIYKRDRTPRRQKRIERSRMKGSTKDAWNLRRERMVCLELLVYAQCKPMMKAVNDLCEVLLLVTPTTTSQQQQRSDSVLLAVQLTSSMQRFVKCMQEHVPPLAPAYPREWLALRSLQCVTLFQDPKARLETKWNKRMVMSKTLLVVTDAEVEELVHAKTWWQLAKENIQCWFDCKFVHLQAEVEVEGIEV
jgi:hypothetical protein